jgi:hypothetical protein
LHLPVAGRLLLFNTFKTWHAIGAKTWSGPTDVSLLPPAVLKTLEIGRKFRRTPAKFCPSELSTCSLQDFVNEETPSLWLSSSAGEAGPCLPTMFGFLLEDGSHRSLKQALCIIGWQMAHFCDKVLAMVSEIFTRWARLKQSRVRAGHAKPIG